LLPFIHSSLRPMNAVAHSCSLCGSSTRHSSVARSPPTVTRPAHPLSSNDISFPRRDRKEDSTDLATRSDSEFGTLICSRVRLIDYVRGSIDRIRWKSRSSPVCDPQHRLEPCQPEWSERLDEPVCSLCP